MNAPTRRFAGVLFGMLLVAATSPAFAHSSAHRAYHLDDGSTVRYDDATGKYCWSYYLTGSHLEHTECKTQEEWAKAGMVINTRDK